MQNQEIKDGEQAKQWLLSGLWMQRTATPSASVVQPALQWALETVQEGRPLPPIGFVFDVGNAALDLVQKNNKEEATALPASLSRAYEDHVLGKLYADWRFERATNALRNYQGRDRDRGVSFVVDQFRERAGFPGVLLSPAIIRSLLQQPPEAVLANAWERLSNSDNSRLLGLYENLIAASRSTSEILGSEDVFELEHKTVLLEMGQRLALRQVLAAAAWFENTVPQHKLAPLNNKREVPTYLLDEDVYPVGGYASISTRGSIESLLHSQLAYMEKGERPDLFDIKFLRDELLYYSRDENQFLRQRRTFVFALTEDMVKNRFKDADVPWQRMVLALGFMVAATRKLAEWLSDDALLFEFVFLHKGEKEPLADERKLLELVFREQVKNGSVRFGVMDGIESLSNHCTKLSHRSRCHCLVASTKGGMVKVDGVDACGLEVSKASPVLTLQEQRDEAEPMDEWASALGLFLRSCL